MVTSHTSAHLLAILVCCSFLPQPSDGAKLYGHPRHLDYEALLDDPQTPETAYDWGMSGGQEVVGGGGEAAGGGVGVYLSPRQLTEEDRALPFTTLDQLRGLLLSAQTRSRGMGHSGLLLPPPPHHAGRAGLGGSEWPWREDAKTKRQMEEMEEQQNEEEEDEDEEEEEEEEEERRQIQLYMAYRHPPAPPASRGGGGAGERGVMKVEQKRWWGGRRQGQVDRRASQTKHYDCLKSCIKEGKLHPIQCHTLC